MDRHEMISLAERYEKQALAQAKAYSRVASFINFKTEFTAMASLFTIAASLRELAGRGK